MLVLCTFVDVKGTQELCTEFILRQHALHYATHQFIGTIGLGHDAGGRVLALTTGIARVAVVHAIRPLLTSELHLCGIDNNYIVTTVNVRSKVGLVLTAKQLGNLRAKTTEHLVGSIYYHPLFLCGLLVSRNGLVT